MFAKLKKLLRWPPRKGAAAVYKENHKQREQPEIVVEEEDGRHPDTSGEHSPAAHSSQKEVEDQRATNAFPKQEEGSEKRQNQSAPVMLTPEQKPILIKYAIARKKALENIKIADDNIHTFTKKGYIPKTDIRIVQFRRFQRDYEKEFLELMDNGNYSREVVSREDGRSKKAREVLEQYYNEHVKIATAFKKNSEKQCDVYAKQHADTRYREHRTHGPSFLSKVLIKDSQEEIGRI